MHRFFSIIVPAHNEEKIIDRTLSLLAALDYPKDRYEVIVVENGSSDATLERAKAHEGGTIRAYTLEGARGVSRARNYGFAQSSPEAGWIIFMDCDVFVAPSFLLETDRYLDAHPEVGYGTTTVNIDSPLRIAAFWSLVNNFFYRLFKVLFTTHIVRRDYAEQVRYIDGLASGEDIEYGRDLAKKGAKYFFMKTHAVRCSDRRFAKNGYFGMFFINLYHGITMFILPEGVLEKIDWEVIR
jgi:glycosyltransferase involved in cell wall biosynthesis